MDRTYDRLESSAIAIRMPFGLFALAIVSLPFSSFIFCVVWSVLYFFERSTATHCGVDNYLPSISAAIGNYQPQRFIWQMSILLQAIPRLLIAKYYYNYFCEIIQRSRHRVVYVVSLLNVVENVALVGLSVWTSSDNYELHKSSFVIFIITSELYMISSYYLYQRGRRRRVPLSRLERRSMNFKLILFSINIFSILLAVYFFNRHNMYCEAGIYTLFALMEYIVVLTNMGYHMTAYWDFNDKSIIFDFNNGLSIQSNDSIRYNRII